MSEIQVNELHQLIQDRNDLLLLDVRTEQEFNTWRIESRYTPETLHIPYIIFVEDEENTAAMVPRGREIIVVCAKGGASDYVADILRGQGVPAINLAGGMISWGNYYVNHTIVETPTFAIYQVERVSRGCLSYILVSQGQAVIIDPLRHTHHYETFLAEKGLQLVRLLDTHAHADHISSGPGLAKAHQAPYYLHPYDGIHPFDLLPAKISYEMLKDGMQFTLGDLTISTLHVPGHTLGLVNFLVSAPDGKNFLLTGDSIFINSFGRPDLGGQGQAWAPLVYEAIFHKIKTSVPGDALVLPGHYARHAEANADGTFARPLADLWQENPDLRMENPAYFQEYVLAHLPDLPQQYIQIKRVNAGLVIPDEQESSELELGKNVCALSTAY